MNEAPNVDIVTGFIFSITVTFAALTAWYYEVRRLRAYSRYGASHKARRHPMHAQLRYSVENGQRGWRYWATW